MFANVTPTNFMGGQGWYVTWIAVDPSNPAIVYVAGAAGINSVLRSVNSGGIWTDIHTGLGGTTSPHVDHHGVDLTSTAGCLMATMAVSTGRHRLLPRWS